MQAENDAVSEAEHHENRNHHRNLVSSRFLSFRYSALAEAEAEPEPHENQNRRRSLASFRQPVQAETETEAEVEVEHHENQNHRRSLAFFRLSALAEVAHRGIQNYHLSYFGFEHLIYSD